MSMDIVLPELGEGITSGIVANISINPGDALSENDPIIEIETDKAVLPVPSPTSGTCISVEVSVGDEIQIGQIIAKMEAGDGAAAPKEEAAPPAEEVKEEKAEAPAAPPEPAAEPSPEPAPAAAAPKPAPPARKKGAIVPAGPATRRFARELGLDLSQVPGSKKGGRIDITDVKAYVKSLDLNSAQVFSPPAPSANGSGSGAGFAPIPLPDYSKFGDIRREKLSNLRNKISERMSRNWATIPHVFQFHELDVTNISELQKRYSADFKERGSTASVTNFFIKALALCLKEFPQFNASLDEISNELVYKEFYNIGIAVDTPSGLIVPVLKDVDKKTIFEIGTELKELAKKTRERKVVPDDLQGGCITLSNLGGIGGTHFTPIINSPEVAILGVGQSEIKPKYIDGEFIPRQMVQVTLSYDHRVIDGADGARFISRLSDIIENFEKILLGG